MSTMSFALAESCSSAAPTACSLMREMRRPSKSNLRARSAACDKWHRVARNAASLELDHLFGNGGKADDVCEGGCRETGRRGPGLATSPCRSLGTVLGFGSDAASAAREVPANSQTVRSVETVCSASVALGDTVATTDKHASALTKASLSTRVSADPRNGGGAGVGLSGFENPPLAFHLRTARDARMHRFRA